jgi:hypothetical protein
VVWGRLDWVVKQVGILPALQCSIGVPVHHLSLALEDLRLPKAERAAAYARLRKALKQGKAEEVITELKQLADARSRTSPVWVEIRYLTKHCEAGRLRYAVFRYRRLPIGSGAIESTIRRAINLRLKGNSIYWTADNAEAVFQLRAAILSGRWEETVAHTRDAIARDRRLAWHWTPPEALQELKDLEAQARKEAKTTAAQQPTRLAA